ncbi:NADP(H)-dependent aldo-keto reductase [Aureibacter tunicatorum]|uniref:Protein tas n=1 Tax=Aureibacter tunicatorum TaxID=866807 RepID=A0AAE3XPH7_9BACT|nr:NADP(H)-dependent aldo-keto reductase [Aureibacter tunicatorum]MDR6239566.1 aryl-alcohol dehydrogenase-like predicted oxidoreductase [Aureibacter tunicatorum]BDD04043.1 oxidoreductase [Aureibacter tunicatorum]
MKYSILGNSDLSISKIGLGTMTFGEQNSEAEGHQQINYALSKGVNFIDTAEMYSVPARPETQGRTEEIIGSWIKKHKNLRDDIVLATKATGPNEYFDYIRSGPSYTAKQLKEALHGSLRRLHTGYIDLYQLHWPERKTNFFGKLGYTHESDDVGNELHEVLQTLSSFVKQGKVLHIGLSNETPWGLMKFLELAKTYNLEKVVSIQNPYNFLNRTFEVGLAEISMREKVGLLAYSPLAFGMLTGKYDNGKTPENSRLTLFPKMKRYTNEYINEAAQAYNNLASEFNLTPAQFSLAFVNSREFVASNIIGATTMEQLKENIESIDITLPEEALKKIEELHDRFTYPAP